MKKTLINSREYLRGVIEQQLTPLIDSDYILLDCPYYANVGDLMIWRGEQEFLQTLEHKSLGEHSFKTFDFRPLDRGVTILLQGGGNFGDIWRAHQVFRKKVIARYPDNKIIILPQSVYYNDPKLLKSDAKEFSKHQNLTICLRDKNSYDIVKGSFSNQVLLVPDMAFFIEPTYLEQWRVVEGYRVLYLKRNDRESGAMEPPIDLSDPMVDIRDWPTMERGAGIEGVWKWRQRALRVSRALSLRSSEKLAHSLDDYWKNTLQERMISEGVRFLSQYKTIYSTRLHVTILAALLGKQSIDMDNNYGKISALKRSWLEE